MQRKGFIVFLLLFFPVLLFGQGLKIKGKVTDNNGEPLLGANVMIAELSLGAATDLDGNFVFDVPSSNVNGQEVKLTASYIGFKQKMTTIVLRGNALEVNFVLEEDIFKSEEIVVTGIASRNSKSVAEVSVARVDAKELTKVQTYQGISELVSGKVSGVQIKTTSGNVGSGFQFKIRGGAGLNGNGQPVIYIDGVRMENSNLAGFAVGGQDVSTLANLNVNDIENFEFLKGPAAAAMYGTGGSNGVVLITTKSGGRGNQSNNVSVNYKFNYGINEPNVQFGDWLNKANRDAAESVYQNGYNTEHSLSVSGGSNTLKYFTSFMNKKEEGIMQPNTMDLNTFRLNVTSFPTENLSIKVRAGYNQNEITRPYNDNALLGYMGNTVLGLWQWNKKENIEQIVDEMSSNQFIGGVSANFKPIKNMEITANYGIDQFDVRQIKFFKPGLYYREAFEDNGRRSIWERYTINTTVDVNARYSYKIMPKFNVTSIVGAQILETEGNSTDATVYGFDTDLTPILDAGTGGPTQLQKWIGETKDHARQAGIFTEHQFNYDNTYMLSLALRRDYANAIGIDAPAATYPKASFALRLDKIIDLPSFIGLFKFRSAYGQTGQLPLLTESKRILWEAINSGYGTSAGLSDIGNTEVEPENISEIELGLDVELFKNISLEYTYFFTTTDNSMVGAPNPPSTGLTATRVRKNIGGFESWGHEALIQYNPIRTAEYNLNFTFIWNYQDNEVVSLGGEADIQSDVNYTMVGQPIHVYYTDVATGEVEFWGEGEREGEYKNAVTEKKIIGNPYPDHTGSLAINFTFLKNFSFYALGEWGLNYKIYNGTQRWTAFTNYSTNDVARRYQVLLGIPHKENAADTWEPLTPGSPEYIAAAKEYAKIDPNVRGNYIQDADYFYLREISLSYDFSDILRSVAGNEIIKSFRAGISARNLYRTSLYYRDDVEVSSDGLDVDNPSYEFLTLNNPRTFNFWITLGL